MIQSKQHGNDWYRVDCDAIYYTTIKNRDTYNLESAITEWCNEQNSQTSYCFVPPRIILDPRTFQPIPVGGEIWFEVQEMANWFTLRWS